MASVHKLALQSLQIGPRGPHQSFQKKRATDTLRRSLDPHSGTPFQGTSQTRTSLPCLSKFGLSWWFCSSGEEGWRRYRSWGEAGRRRETALSVFEWPFIKDSLLLKKTEEGRKETKALSFPKKAEQGLQCLFQALPKMKLQI